MESENRTMTSRSRRRHLSYSLALLTSPASSFINPQPTRRSHHIHRQRPYHSFQFQSHLTNDTLLQTYTTLLQSHPLTTKSLTAALLACAGDAIAQSRSSAESYDIRRGFAFVVFGAAYTGAFQHYWFGYLSEHVEEWGRYMGIWSRHANASIEMIQKEEWWRYFDVISTLENTPSPEALAAGKLILNQLVVVPIVYMPLFFAFTGLISGLDVNQSVARARSLYFPILRRNYFYWLPVQFMQFLVIPMDFQIPFVSVASLIWTIILSSIGGGTAPVSPSSIVAYETEEEYGEEIVTISRVESGPANKITDDVRLQDVTNALIPDPIVETVAEVAEAASNDVARLTTSGLAAGLLASAADEAAIGSAVGGLMGVEASVGVAIVSAAGAGLGFLAAANRNEDSMTMTDESTLIDDDSTMIE